MVMNVTCQAKSAKRREIFIPFILFFSAFMAEMLHFMNHQRGHGHFFQCMAVENTIHLLTGRSCMQIQEAIEQGELPVS